METLFDFLVYINPFLRWKRKISRYCNNIQLWDWHVKGSYLIRSKYSNVFPDLLLPVFTDCTRNVCVWRHQRANTTFYDDLLCVAQVLYFFFPFIFFHLDQSSERCVTLKAFLVSQNRDLHLGIIVKGLPKKAKKRSFVSRIGRWKGPWV